MIAYATVSEMKRNIDEGALWADWKLVTRCWEYGWVLRHGRFEPGLKCLDAGCGQAPLLGELAARGCEAHGLDHIASDAAETGYGIPREWIETFAGRIHFHEGDMFHAPFPDDSFDRVTCLSVLEHVMKPAEPRRHDPCLLEMRRILKPGGLLIATVDFFLSPEVMSYDYRDDVRLLGMELLDPTSRLVTRADILADEDAYVVPPAEYLKFGYGKGWNLRQYHRLTSVGYILRKP
jgi:ubiquinone/menaquinone biosynthesis C-methylase UbiE